MAELRQLAQRVRDLYEAARFVDAFRLTEPHWSSPSLAEGMAPEELVLAGRLSSRLGGVRVAGALFRQALETAPDHPAVRYFCRGVRAKAGLFSELEDFVSRPELETDDADLRTSWLASHASAFAMVRDFERAAALIERAHHEDTNAGWVDSCHCEILSRQDRREEALFHARRAWERQPGMPYSASALLEAHNNLNRGAEALEILRGWVGGGGQSFDVLLMLISQVLHESEKLDLAGRRQAADEVRALAARFDSLAPLSDRLTRRALNAQLMEAARISGDHMRMRELAVDLDSAFYNAVAANIERNPEGRRVILPHEPVRQDHNTCLPASVCTLLPAFGRGAQQSDLARELTFEGTPSWRVAQWAANNGMKLRHFHGDAASMKRLIEAGVPFILGLESLNSAHATAVIGADFAMGTVLIHDPGRPGLGEMLMEHAGMGEAPLGPRCAAIYPLERAAQLDTIELNDEQGATVLQEFFRVREQQSVAAAVEYLTGTGLSETPVGQYLQAIALGAQGHSGESLERMRALFARWPDCVLLQRGVITGTTAMGNTGVLRETLHSIVTREPLPGTSLGRDYIYAAPHLLARYADILRRSATSLGDARRFIQRALRRGPFEAEVYSVLGEMRWQTGEFAQAELPFRIAACLHYESDGCARAYADVLHKLGREREAMDWLARRARYFATKLDAHGPWRLLVDTLEDYGFPTEALAELGEGLALRPEDGELAAFAAVVYSRYARNAEADAALEVAGRHASRGEYHRAAGQVAASRGDIRQALEHTRKRVEEEPQAFQARGHLAYVTEQVEGPAAAMALVRRWVKEHPADESYEELLLERLDRSTDREERAALLQARVKRNPDDAWAWRELAIMRLEHTGMASATGRVGLLKELEFLVQRCEQTCPDHEVTCAIRGDFELLLGHSRQASEHYQRALQIQPGYAYAMNRLLDVASKEGGQAALRAADTVDQALARTSGQWTLAPHVANRLGQVLGVDEARARVSRWLRRARRDPYPVAAWAELLLEHGRGVKDAARVVRRLKRAISRFPLHMNLRYALAHALSVLDRTAEEMEALRELVGASPRDVRARVLLSECLEARGAHEEAEAELRRACEIEPLDYRVWSGLAEFFVRRGETERAIEVLAQAVKVVPDAMALWSRRCEILSQSGRGDEALEVGREVAALYPEGAYAQLLLARAMRVSLVRARRKDVEAQYERALKLNAQLFDAVDEYTSFLCDHAQYDRALKIIDRHVPLVEEGAPLLAKRAEILRAQRRTRESLDAVIELVKVRPEYAWGWHLLMEWSLADKRGQEARALLDGMHPSLESHTTLLAERIEFLEHIGTERAQTETAWTRALQDFPQAAALHFRRFDRLLSERRSDDAHEVITSYARFAPDEARTLSAQVKVACLRKERDIALFFANRLWFESHGNSWAYCGEALDALIEAGWMKQVMDGVLGRLSAGELPLPVATRVLAVKAAAASLKVPLVRMAELIEPRALEFGSWDVYSSVLDALSDCDNTAWVLKFKERHSPQCHSDTQLWMVVGRALQKSDRHRDATDWLAVWRRRQGVEMWAVTNLVCAQLDLAEFNEAAQTGLEALTVLEHDHTAGFLAGHTLVGLLLSRGISAAMAELETWRDLLAREESPGVTSKALGLFEEMSRENRGGSLFQLDLRMRHLVKNEGLPQGKALLKLWTKSLRQRLPWPHFLWHVVTRLLPF